VYAAGLYNIERTEYEDRFGLAVLTFHLLMEGVHPFACKYVGQGEPPHHQQNIVSGNFAYSPRSSDFKPTPLAPSFEMVAPELRALFTRCFVDGHANPSARPSAKEWRDALNRAAAELVVCQENEHHYFGKHLGGRCPWCERKLIIGRDPFPKVVEPPKPKQTAPVTLTFSQPESKSHRWLIGSCSPR
jgi:DNA-binding helix-hairpin-helix protein with protein kinase domain